MKATQYRKIALTRGKFVLVDVADFEWLNQWKWRALKVGKKNGNFYAARAITFSVGKQCNLCMHRLILGLDRGDQRQGDHRNGRTLDNRRSNLRIATPRQNCGNRRKRRDNQTKYKGVGWHTYGWRARIMFKGQSICIGHFPDPVLAAKAYDTKALELFGDFAVLNFPKEGS